MAQTYSRAEKLAGLFLFLAILGAVGGILLVGQGKGWFQQTQTYITNFPQSYNLQPGAAVKMFNTEIGTVTRLRIIRIKDVNQVEVTLRVNAKYSDLIRLDSVAQVESPTILGSEYLSISPGTYGYPPIESHGTIPSRIKKTLADYLEELQPEESLRKAKLFISNMAYLSEQFKSHEQKLLATISHFDELLVNVIEAKGTLGKLLMQKDFYNRLESAVIRVESILKNSEVISKDIKVSSGKIPNLMDKVNQELDQVKYILIDLRKASGQLPALVETTDEVARSGKEVIDAVKANPLIQWTAPKSPVRESISSGAAMYSLILRLFGLGCSHLKAGFKPIAKSSLPIIKSLLPMDKSFIRIANGLIPVAKVFKPIAKNLVFLLPLSLHSYVFPLPLSPPGERGRVRGEFFRIFGHTYTFLFLLCLLGLMALGCAKRPDAYGRQVTRAMDSSFQGQELLSEGKDRRAEKAFNKSLEINRSIDNPVGTARQLNNLAAVALTRGDFAEAKKLFQQALFINQEFGDAAGAAINLANLATLAQINKNIPQAESYLQEARSLARQSKSAKVQGQVLCQMAGLALDQQDPGTAAVLLEEARPLAREPEVKGSWNFQQGRIFLARGDTVKAMYAFQEALAADRTILNRNGMGADLQGLGQVWENQGDFSKSFLYYSRAFELYAATDRWEKARLCLDTLRRLNKTGRLGLSLKPYEKQLADSQAAPVPGPAASKTTGPANAKTPTEAATASPVSVDDVSCPPATPKP